MPGAKKYDISAIGGACRPDDDFRAFLGDISDDTLRETAACMPAHRLVEAVAAGPAPPALLVRLAREAGFRGNSL
jgi:hypothetical protein